ncbi:restriction endonuclease subunit S [Ruthenibacterium lactatiformans]|uniref:restriction endonuclease subunit S n=1 Tax=Ruthenibacterium lactatiformans TaxID=1550024 RepID=UPI0022E8832B|nr:restriction endonuclease subunit S [Ruthenibacterium lactatiformans]
MSKVEYKNTHIKDIGRVVTGKTPETKKAEFYGDGYMFITPTELHDGYNIQVSEKYITELGLQSIKSNCIEETSVMVGCIGWDMGNVAICHRKCATNQQINSITDFNPKYNPFYTYYWLLTKKDYLFTIASVTRTPILSKSTFEEIVIPMPDRSIQDNVVGILKSIDDKIENNKRICFELEAMAKTIYDYWFVQFDFPDENGKPYHTSGGEMVWNEQLKREIPKGGEVTNIGNLTTVVTGKEDANFSSPNGKYKFFTCSQEALLCDTPAFSGQAVLIAGNGDFNVKHYSGEFNAYQRTYVLIPENQIYYGAMYISAKNQIQAFKNGSNGSIVKFITKGDVENIPFILPNDDSIFHQINKLIEKIELCERENEELTKLRDWLLPMLMNGQARVE